MTQKAEKIPNSLDRLLFNQKQIKELYGMTRLGTAVLSVAAPIFSLGQDGGSVASSQNGLSTSGGTIYGPLIFNPKLGYIDNGRLNISFDFAAQLTADNAFTTNVLVTGLGSSPFNLRFIDGAIGDGQLLYYQSTNQQVQIIKNANLLSLTNIVGDGNTTVTVLLSDTGTLVNGDTVNILVDEFSDENVIIANLVTDTSFTYQSVNGINTIAETAGLVQDGNIITHDGQNLYLDGAATPLNVPVITLKFDSTAPGGAWRVLGTPHFDSTGVFQLTGNQIDFMPETTVAFNNNDIFGSGITDEGVTEQGVFKLQGSLFTMEGHLQLFGAGNDDNLTFQWQRADDVNFTTNVLKIGTIGQSMSQSFSDNDKNSSMPFAFAQVDAGESDVFVRLRGETTDNDTTGVLAQGSVATITSTFGGGGALGGGGTGDGYDIIQDEGSGLTQRSIFNFIGSGVIAVDNPAQTRTDITISGGDSQTPWLSNIDAAGFSLQNLLSLDIEDSAGATKLGISGPLGVGARFSFVTGDSLIFTENVTDRLTISSASVKIGADLDYATFDGTNIDRLRFVSDSAAPVSDGDPSIYLDGASNMVFNVNDQKQYFWSMFNKTRMQLDQAGVNNDTILTVETDSGDALAIPFVNIFRDDPTPQSGLGGDSEITNLQFSGTNAATNGGASAGSNVYSQIITTYESVITGREASSLNFFTSFDTGVTTQLKSFLGINNSNSDKIEAFVDLNMGDNSILKVNTLELQDTTTFGAILFNADGARDTFISSDVTDEDRINVTVNGAQGVLFGFSTLKSLPSLSLTSSGSAFINVSSNFVAFDPLTEPLDAIIVNNEGLVFFDDTTDPAILKIKKKDSVGAVTIVSLEGSGGGFPIDFPEEQRGPVGGSTQIIDFTQSDRHAVIMELTGDIGISLTNTTAGKLQITSIKLKQDGVGGHAFTGFSQTVANEQEIIDAVASASGSNEFVVFIVRKIDGLFTAFLEDSNSSGGGGEANTGTNVGSGTGQVFRDKTGITLNFKTLLQGSNITITNNADDITISSTDSNAISQGDSSVTVTDTGSNGLINFVTDGTLQGSIQNSLGWVFNNKMILGTTLSETIGGIGGVARDWNPNNTFRGMGTTALSWSFINAGRLNLINTGVQSGTFLVNADGIEINAPLSGDFVEIKTQGTNRAQFKAEVDGGIVFFEPLEMNDEIKIDGGNMIHAFDSVECGFAVTDEITSPGTEGTMQMPRTSDATPTAAELDADFGSALGCHGLATLGGLPATPIWVVKVDTSPSTWRGIILSSSGNLTGTEFT